PQFVELGLLRLDLILHLIDAPPLFPVRLCALLFIRWGILYLVPHRRLPLIEFALELINVRPELILAGVELLTLRREHRDRNLMFLLLFDYRLLYDWLCCNCAFVGHRSLSSSNNGRGPKRESVLTTPAD